MKVQNPKVIKDEAARELARHAFREGVAYAHNWLNAQPNADCVEAATSLICKVVWHEKAVEKYPDPEPEFNTQVIDGMTYRYNPSTKVFEIRCSDGAWEPSISHNVDRVVKLSALLRSPFAPSGQ